MYGLNETDKNIQLKALQAVEKLVHMAGIFKKAVLVKFFTDPDTSKRTLMQKVSAHLILEPYEI